jgi:hypothetical protein
LKTITTIPSGSSPPRHPRHCRRAAGRPVRLITFSDRVLSFVRAKSGQAHYDACRDRLYTLQPQSVSPDFDELCSFIRLRLRKRALLIFLTALDDPLLAEGFASASELISRQHLLIVDMVQPPGAVPVFANEACARSTTLPAPRGHLQWHVSAKLRKVETRGALPFDFKTRGSLSPARRRQTPPVAMIIDHPASLRPSVRRGRIGRILNRLSVEPFARCPRGGAALPLLLSESPGIGSASHLAAESLLKRYPSR